MTFCSEPNSTRLALCVVLSLLLLCISNTDAVEKYVDKPTDMYKAHGLAVSDIPARKPSPVSRAIHDNGMLHLVLHYLSLKLIQEMEADQETMLNKRQSQLLHDRITGFYDEILKHPALNESRVAFSQKKPDFAQFRPDYPEDSPVTGGRVKRGGRLTEICNSVSSWQEEHEGVTRTHDVVGLFPNQHFYTTRCLGNGQSCNYIDESSMTSECRSRSSWTIAYVADGPYNYMWEWIAIDTCCSCAASS